MLEKCVNSDYDTIILILSSKTEKQVRNFQQLILKILFYLSDFI